MITKGFYISLLVVAGILCAASILFHDSETGLQASAAAAIVIGAVVLRVFDTREGRGGQGHD